MTKTVNRLSDEDFNLTKTRPPGATLEAKLKKTAGKTSGNSSQATLVDFNLTKTANKIPSGKTFKRSDVDLMATQI